jgi:hypothetical protein
MSQLRATKARAASHLSIGALKAFSSVGLLLLAVGIVLGLMGQHYGYTLTGLGLMVWAIATWLRGDLLDLPAAPFAQSSQLTDILPSDVLNAYSPTIPPSSSLPLPPPPGR